MIRLTDIHKVRMLGIGGIGMSALARFLKLKGKEVSGYDRSPSRVTKDLQEAGIGVEFSENPERVEGADILIYTPAVPRSHPEFAAAEALNIPILKRSEVLGLISKDYRCIAIGGTHGKTSTTALTTHLMRACGIDAVGFIGGIVNNFNSNFVWGKSDWVVVEADEFDRSFLTLSPEIAVITAMDPDHLDIYGNEAGFEQAFLDFGDKIVENGLLIHAVSLGSRLEKVKATKIGYGVEAGEIEANELKGEGLKTHFNYRSSLGEISDLEMPFPGKYNVENATAAISAVLKAGGTATGIREGLKSFKGVWRRFDIRHQSEDAIYVDDYAHHPEEIRAVLQAVRKNLPDWRIEVAFQPHLFSRTRDFYEGFAEALSLADRVLLLPIYPAREEAIPGVSSELIFDRLSCAAKEMTDKEQLPVRLLQAAASPTVYMTLGAGDIDACVGEIEKVFGSQKGKERVNHEH